MFYVGNNWFRWGSSLGRGSIGTVPEMCRGIAFSAFLAFFPSFGINNLRIGNGASKYKSPSPHQLNCFGINY